MAGFNYTGWAGIKWPDKKQTVQFIDYCAETGTLSVWPENDEMHEREYLGTMKDHPATHIQFFPGYKG